MTALALRDDQTQWDSNQLAVLHQSGIDGDVTEPELMAFLHECQRRKLDPFSRQIYLIGRYDRNKGRKVYRSQTSIDGFRLIARRAADKSGIDYSYEDTIWFDDKGQRHEVWLSPGVPAAAKVVVIRNGQRFDAVARYGAYVQTNRDGEPLGLWRSMPDVLIAKCAEGLALRKAFPEDLGGIYTEEEMAQADNPQRVTATAEVIRDEPAQQNGDSWYVRPAPEQAAAEEWVAAALRLIPDIRLEACRKLWRETVEKARNGELADDETRSVLGPLKTRMEALAEPAQDAGAAPSAEPETDSPVADGLDPDDPWAAKVEEIASEEEADDALVEASVMLGNGEIDGGHFGRIEAAILARFPESGKEVAAA
jgi:phage recombination protein Bet